MCVSVNGATTDCALEALTFDLGFRILYFLTDLYDGVNFFTASTSNSFLASCLRDASATFFQ